MTGIRRHVAMHAAIVREPSAASVTACAAPPRSGEKRTASIPLVSAVVFAIVCGSIERPIVRRPRSHHAAYESYMPSRGEGSVPP